MIHSLISRQIYISDREVLAKGRLLREERDVSEESRVFQFENWIHSLLADLALRKIVLSFEPEGEHVFFSNPFVKNIPRRDIEISRNDKHTLYINEYL